MITEIPVEVKDLFIKVRLKFRSRSKATSLPCEMSPAKWVKSFLKSVFRAAGSKLNSYIHHSDGAGRMQHDRWSE